VGGDFLKRTFKNPTANTERVIPENFIFDYRSLARDNRNEIYPESDLVFVVSSNR